MPGAPLSVRFPVVRRVAQVRAGFEVAAGGASLNVLVVTARPDGARDVGYRTVSRPLLGALRQARVPVNVELVRPGTWAALREHLRAATQRHGSGWYRIVHFDVHGAVLDGEGAGETQAGQYQFATVPANGNGSGREPVLFFETGEEGRAEAVSTDAVAELLVEHRVPVAVMNACQSAMQAARERGVAGAAAGRGRRAGGAGDGVLGHGLGRGADDAGRLRPARRGQRSARRGACRAAAAL